MSLISLVERATDKERFQTIQDYIDFCKIYLQFVETGLQARIVAQNENRYQFYQYRDDGYYNITRPINTSLMYEAAFFENASIQFLQVLEQLRNRDYLSNNHLRQVLVRSIYTLGQSIGAALDALPSGKSRSSSQGKWRYFRAFNSSDYFGARCRLCGWNSKSSN